MKTEHFTPYSFPDISHAERKKRLERGKSTLLEERLAYIKNGGMYVGETMLDPDELFAQISFQKEIKRSQGLPDNITEVLSEAEKGELFGPIVEEMQNIAGSYGLSLPAETLSRLFILHNHDMGQLIFQETGEPLAAMGRIDIGITLPDKSCLVNYDLASMALFRYPYSVPKELPIQTVGTHELWHSVAYSEIWQPRFTPYAHYTNKQLEKRSGFCIKGPIPNSEDLSQSISQRFELFYAFHVLNEGLAEHLTQKTLKKALSLEHDPPLSYPNHKDLMDLLISQIGIRPILAAHLTREGLAIFFQTMRKRYGNNAIMDLAHTITEDFLNTNIKDMNGQENNQSDSQFPKTKIFLTQ